MGWGDKARAAQRPRAVALGWGPASIVMRIPGWEARGRRDALQARKSAAESAESGGAPGTAAQALAYRGFCSPPVEFLTDLFAILIVFPCVRRVFRRRQGGRACAFPRRIWAACAVRAKSS